MWRSPPSIFLSRRAAGVASTVDPHKWAGPPPPSFGFEGVLQTKWLRNGSLVPTGGYHVLEEFNPLCTRVRDHHTHSSAMSPRQLPARSLWFASGKTIGYETVMPCVIDVALWLCRGWCSLVVLVALWLGAHLSTNCVRCDVNGLASRHATLAEVL